MDDKPQQGRQRFFYRHCGESSIAENRATLLFPIEKCRPYGACVLFSIIPGFRYASPWANSERPLRGLWFIKLTRYPTSCGLTPLQPDGIMIANKKRTHTGKPGDDKWIICRIHRPHPFKASTPLNLQAMPIRSRPVATVKTRSRPVNSSKFKSLRDLATLTPLRACGNVAELLSVSYQQETNL